MQGMSAPPSGKIGNGGVLFGGAREKEREKARDKPGFFARGGAGVDILGGLADGLAQYFGGQPQYVPAMYKRQQDERNHNQRLAQMQEERSEEHTSELQSLMRISYAVFCLKKKNKRKK